MVYEAVDSDKKTITEEEVNKEIQKVEESGIMPYPLGKTPSFVIQPNVMSQASYDVSVVARKLVAMALSLIPPDLSNLTAQFNLYDFYEAMGIKQGGTYDEQIIKALDECMAKNILFKTVRIVNGEKIHDTFNFFSHTQYNEKTKNILMIFNKSLADYLIGFKKMFSKIQLENIGKLSSKYSIRIYEMAISYMGFEGKQGNKKGTWYFELDLDQFRNTLGIQSDQYRLFSDLRKNVIDIPLMVRFRITSCLSMNTLI